MTSIESPIEPGFTILEICNLVFKLKHNFQVEDIPPQFWDIIGGCGVTLTEISENMRDVCRRSASNAST